MALLAPREAGAWSTRTPTPAPTKTPATPSAGVETWVMRQGPDGKFVLSGIAYAIWPGEAAPPTVWMLTVIDPLGKEVARIRQAGEAPGRVEWYGRDSDGRLAVAAEKCGYRLRLEDDQGAVLGDVEALPGWDAMVEEAAAMNPEIESSLAAEAMEIESATVKLPPIRQIAQGWGWMVELKDKATGETFAKIQGTGQAPASLSLPKTKEQADEAHLVVTGDASHLPMQAQLRYAVLDGRGAEQMTSPMIPVVPKSHQVMHAAELRPNLAVDVAPQFDKSGKKAERVVFKAIVDRPRFVKSWRAHVVDASGKEISAWSGTSGEAVPTELTWNTGPYGTTWGDLFYKYVLVDVTGVERITTGPLRSLESLAELKEFGTRNLAELSFAAAPEGKIAVAARPVLSFSIARWGLDITDPSGKVIAHLTGAGYVPPKFSFDIPLKADGTPWKRSELGYVITLTDAFDTMEEQQGGVLDEGDAVPSRVRRQVRISEFGFGASEVRPYMYVQLHKASELMQVSAGAVVEVRGFTDSVGKREKNLALSMERARNAASYLEKSENADLSQAMIAGFGPDGPIASNDNDEGRAKNRRVEIAVTVAK